MYYIYMLYNTKILKYSRVILGFGFVNVNILKIRLSLFLMDLMYMQQFS